MTTQLRGVSCLRLSVLTDETTSPERQRAANQGAASALGIDLGNREAVDLGVSASKTTPFERPELGAWLRRPDEFDALVCWRFDRLVRSMQDMHDLSKWAREHKKVVVFAEGPGGRLVLDFRNPLDPMAQLMVTLFAFAAEMEAQSIRERVTSAQAAMRTMPFRWRGSRPPYGYVSVPLESGGWTLTPAREAVPDCGPSPVAVIERIIAAIQRGETVSAIAEKLNTDGIPSPRDWWSLLKGREKGGKTGGTKGGKAVTRNQFRWTPGAITKLLRSHSLIGWKTHQGNPVRDSDGKPVMATSEPILTRAEFDAVGALMVSRSANNSERKDTNSLLLGVIHCFTCGGRMYLCRPTKNGARIRGHYACNAHARGERCEAPTNIRADWADDYVTREFLRILGGLEITHTRTIPGYDPQPEIDATLAEYEDHMNQQGRQRSNAARAAWQRHADALDARLAELESRERIEPRTEEIRTGRTYAEMWIKADTAGRRKMLTEAGAHLTVKRGTRGGWRSLDERRVDFDVREPFFGDAAADLTAMAAELEANEGA
ncbi:recombinase family protein [Streptomyces sp. AC558_RSS880]|uniref:recombinase family protein n=1 Tax=Streptomyces sp. AC558_RSS880 TaxID=2823687 RepID=UPI0027E4F385|nr:recombinase family protein [Streptomyces sp. AC558_RSS880]